LSLSKKAREKIIHLAGEVYDADKNTLRLVGKR